MRCVICGDTLPPASRADRRTCSARCRMTLSRRLTRATACRALNTYLAADDETAPAAWDAYVRAAAKEAR